VLWSPLTDEIATALTDYLRQGRPQLAVRYGATDAGTRQIRHSIGRSFSDATRPRAYSSQRPFVEALQKWSRRSELPIPFHGANCLRHSYAVHLLRSGQSLKTIGDLLGHRSMESTCVYLRLATDDLREVALSFPAGAAVPTTQENAR
jgi:integrase/recombinase XerD